MRKRDLVLANCLDLALATVCLSNRLTGGGRRAGLSHPRRRSFETRFRIDQELSRHNDVLTHLQSLVDFRLSVAVKTDVDIDRNELAVALRDDDDIALAGPDHRFGGHEQHVLVHGGCEVDRYEHSRHELIARIGELDARLQRTRCRIHFGQDCAHLALERDARQRRRACLDWIAGTDHRRKILGNLRVHPNR